MGAVGVIIVVLTTIASSRSAPTVAPALPAVAEPTAPVCPTTVPAWNLDAQQVKRIGYRSGRRHVFEVVRLGPTDVEVEVATARAFLAMREAAAKACIDLRLQSGFRTLAEQRALFRKWRKGRGNKAARPGQSNHQSGRALDIVVAVPGSLEWLEANAALFGFKRTVRSEPWHWEYVDGAIAAGTPKRVSRKASKHAKAVVRATRPVKRAPAPRATSGRVAASH